MTSIFSPALLITEVEGSNDGGSEVCQRIEGYCAQRNWAFGIKQAIICGRPASFCVEKFGPEALQNITPEALMERLDRFWLMMQFEVPGLRQRGI